MMCGRNLQSAEDKLLMVDEGHLYKSLVSPKPQTVAAISQLRIVYSLDLRKYSELKRQLPYVVCGTFTPPYRNSDNFAYTDSFILDFDHLGAKGLTIDDVRNRLKKDSRVVMCFSSPSEDGLKVLFHLKEKCYDKGIYSLFYKEFASKFSISLGLEQVIDSRTSDVSRACFVSVDSEAYYNSTADPVDLKAFVDIDDPFSVAELIREQKKTPPPHFNKEESSIETDSAPKEPDKDILAKIRQTLNPKAAIKPKDVYVPEELKRIIGSLQEFVNSKGILITEVIDIQYGKKIRATMGSKEAEVNIFHGKHGFRTIISPRRGTDTEANEILHLAIENFFAEL